MRETHQGTKVSKGQPMKRGLEMIEVARLIAPILVVVVVVIIQYKNPNLPIADSATVIIAYFMWLTVNVTQRLEKERMRPLVVSDFIYKDGHICVEVRNDGLGLAKDVNVKFPDQVVAGSGGDYFPLSSPITLLSPSKTKFVRLKRIEEFSSICENLECNIKVSYKDTVGKKYKDSFLHDLTPVMQGLSDG